MTKAINDTAKTKFSLPEVVPILISYIGICVIIGILSPFFFTYRNLLNVGQFSSMMVVTAMGMTMVIVSGGIDISIGATMGLTCMTIAKIIPDSGYAFLFILLGIGVGVVCGSINGLAVTVGQISPLIATLATMSIYRGFAYIWNNGISLPISNQVFGILGRGYIGDVVPVSLVVMVVAVVLFYIIMKYTVFGRKIYSIGGNAKSSHLSGINVRLNQFTVYVICGAMAGLAGTILASKVGAGVANGGTGYELDTIAAVILGGTSLSGGKGNILGSFIGVLILVTLNNGMNLLGVQSFWQMVLKGVVLMLAVILDVIRNKRFESV